MTTFKKDRFSLIAQGITGQKVWHYEDTGAAADIEEVAGFFPAGDHGVDTGDFVILKGKNIQSGADPNRTTRGASFYKVQDTGASQGTLGAGTIIGDTS